MCLCVKVQESVCDSVDLILFSSTMEFRDWTKVAKLEQSHLSQQSDFSFFFFFFRVVLPDDLENPL